MTKAIFCSLKYDICVSPNQKRFPTFRKILFFPPTLFWPDSSIKSWFQVSSYPELLFAAKVNFDSNQGNKIKFYFSFPLVFSQNNLVSLPFGAAAFIGNHLKMLPITAHNQFASRDPFLHALILNQECIGS